MKKIIITLIMILASVMSIAHPPDITIKDNKDGTFHLSVKFPNEPGETVGSTISIVLDKPYNGSSETIDGNLVLYSTKLGESEEITLYKPKTKKYYLNIYVMPAHEYNRVDVPKLTNEEKEIWEKKINEDKNLTEIQKQYLLGIKKD